MKNDLKFYESGSIEILYGYSNHCFPIHSHDAFCIGIVLDGEVTFKIKNKEKKLNKNMIFIIPSNTGVKIDTASQYKYITICIKNELKDNFNCFDYSDYFITLKSSSIFLDMCKKFKQDNNENELINTLLEITKCVSYKKISDNTENNIVPQICSYLIEHADSRFDLDKLADNFYFSKYYLIKMFKHNMGVTPKQYHTQAKMRLLKHEILQNKSEINLAINLNLTDSSHMCKIFKKYMGISLKSYKDNYLRR